MTNDLHGLSTSTPPPLQRRSSSSAKRSRGQDVRYLLPPCQTPDKEELAPIETFVESALSSQNQTYRSIIDCLRKRNDATMLHRLLIVLRTNGTTLHQLIAFPKQHAELLHTIFRLDPFVVPPKMANDDAFNRIVETYALADAHLHFMVAIVSANSTFLHPALNALWKLLMSNNSNKGDASTIHSPTNEIFVEGKIQRLHAALATLLRLVPKGTTDLFPIVVSNFPFRAHANVVTYAKRCMALLEYAPTLEPQMLELLIDKALEIDVEIRIKDGGQVEIDEEKFIKPQDDDDAIFELELDDRPTKLSYDQGKEGMEHKIDEMADKVRIRHAPCLRNAISRHRATLTQRCAFRLCHSTLVGFNHVASLSTFRITSSM